jgi:xanthine dehydrogenase iron-sulfur cluster and FAD-binding subunit A
MALIAVQRCVVLKICHQHYITGVSGSCYVAPHLHVQHLWDIPLHGLQCGFYTPDIFFSTAALSTVVQLPHDDVSYHSFHPVYLYCDHRILLITKPALGVNQKEL